MTNATASFGHLIRQSTKHGEANQSYIYSTKTIPTMAPFENEPRTVRGNEGIFRLRRDTSAARAAPMQAADASSGPAVSPSVYLGLGIGVGGAILLAVIVVTVQIVKRRREHRRLLEVMEVEQAVQVARMHEIGDIPRPTSVARCGSLVPLHGRAGWGALSSDEAVNDPTAARSKKDKRISVSLPKRLKQRGIPLKRLKRLTAIMESPRSRATASPAVPFLDPLPSQSDLERKEEAKSITKAYTLRKVDVEDVFVCPGSPKLEVLPSFAIRSPGRYGAGIANNDNPKAARSRSVGALVVPVFNRAALEQPSRPSRPSMHARSISLGAPTSRPPSGPVPPLPVIAPHADEIEAAAREGGGFSRRSSSSQESAGSSVLITSPILKLNEQDKAIGSPTVEQLVAEDDSASLKTVSKRQWQKPLVARSRPRARTGANRDGAKSASIRSNIAHYSMESLYSRRQSSISIESSDGQPSRQSTAHVGTADQISISRVSSENSLNSYSSLRKITTPRKGTRTSVSAYGSPAERRKTSVLRDISANSITPQRQPSNATQDSSRSSNGNPFQWDTQPLAKPSALKGSPNARKGHRRQNCVRISTLMPQILGPPPSRPTSPNIMHGIEEESGDSEDVGTGSNKLKFVSNHRLSRPASASSFVPNLRIQTLRASLTPSSPTLSAWTAFQEHGLPLQHSDSQLSTSGHSASPATRTTSRQSNRSSLFIIPSFPSPVKPSISNIQLNQPVPEFYLSRPSTDIPEGESSSLFALHLASDPVIPSSPPLLASRQQEYDPAHPEWPSVSILAPKGPEYDPASPVWDTTEPERSSPVFPFAANTLYNPRSSDEVSPRSRPTSYGGDMPDTPPCSPKTMPEGFQAFFDKQDSGSKPARAAEKLTSANASAVMASITMKPVDFPGAPILPPPAEPQDYCPTTPSRTSPTAEELYHPMRFQPMRPAPPPPTSNSGSAAMPAMPSPLHIGNKPGKSVSKPSGPRNQPAQSVLKNAMALRRMNSEVNDFPGQSTSSRESRRYVRLGREASPLLPWVGSPDPNDSCADMDELFDFGFASAEGACGGAEEDRDEELHTSALDEIDMTEVERKLDGAIAGFQTADSGERRDTGSSVWEDGEKFWESSPLPGLDKCTPKKDTIFEGEVWATSRRSIQCTPKSLYDSDGFLRT